MAELIKAGEFVGRGEEPTARHFEHNLPKKWDVVCNKELVDPRGVTREVDFIVIGENCVFVIDEKSWSGEIYGNENGWVLPSGESYLNPLGKVGFLARRLAGILRGSIPVLKREATDHFVFGRIVMSSAGARVRVHDPRVRTEVLTLQESANKLVAWDKQEAGVTPVKSLRNRIRDVLVGLPNRPKIPRRIGEYEIVESLDGGEGCRLLRGVHEDGTERLLRLIRKPSTADPNRFSSLRNALLREYETLKRLAVRKCSPSVDPYFSWEDDSYWVIPISPVCGKTLRASRSSGAPDSQTVGRVVESAFDTLSRVHEEGILHRGLTPDRIFITEDGVMFSDFLIARIGGESTVMNHAAGIDPETPYWGPECRLGLELSSGASDVFSLAACLHYWITGQEASEDGKFEAVINARSDLGDVAYIDEVLCRCLMEDDRERPSAAEVSQIVRENGIEHP